MSDTAPVVIFTHGASLFERRGLLYALAGRDIRARYRQSFLGIYWAVLNPILQTAVYALVFTRLLRVGSEGLPFVVLYFSGVAWWNFFSTAATVGVSLLVAGLNVLYRDVSQLVNLVFTLGFFLTPVVYDVASVPERWRIWLLLNPIATAIHGTRAGMFAGTVPPVSELLPGTLVAIALLAIGAMAFRRLQATFTEVL